MKGKHVYVLSYNTGVLGIYEKKMDAVKDRMDYSRYDYKGLKIEEWMIA